MASSHQVGGRESFPLQRCQERRGAMRTFASVLRNIALVLFPRPGPPHDAAEDEKTRSSLLLDEDKHFRKKARSALIMGKSTASFKDQASDDCKLVTARDDEAGFSNALCRLPEALNGNGKDFRALRCHSLCSSSTNSQPTSALLCPGDMPPCKAAMLRSPLGEKCPRRGSKEHSAFPQSSASSDRATAQWVGIPADLPATNASGAAFQATGQATCKGFSEAEAVSSSLPGTSRAAFGTQTGPSLQVLGEGLHTRQASTQTSRVLAEETPPTFTRCTGPCTIETDDTPNGTAPKGTCSASTLSTTSSTAVVAASSQWLTEARFLPPGLFPPCWSDSVYLAAQSRESASPEGGQDSGPAESQSSRSGDSEALLALVEICPLQSSGLEAVQGLSNPRSDYEPLKCPTVKRFSWPSYGTHAPQHNPVLPWDGKDAMFPRSLLGEREETEIGSLLSGAFRDSFVKKRVFSAPAIPTTVISVEHEARSQKQPVLLRTLPPSAASKKEGTSKPGLKTTSDSSASNWSAESAVAMISPSVKTTASQGGYTKPPFRIAKAAEGIVSPANRDKGSRGGCAKDISETTVRTDDGQMPSQKQQKLGKIAEEDCLAEQRCQRKVHPVRSVDDYRVRSVTAANMKTRLQSFSISAVTRRTVATQATMVEQKPAGDVINGDRFFADAVRLCKNPMHQADSKAGASGYCPTCKNPRHNPGYLAAVLLSRAPKYATVRHCKNPKHQHVDQEMDAFLPVGGSEAGMPVLSVKSKQGGSQYPSHLPVFCKVMLPLTAAIGLLALVYVFLVDFWPATPPNMTTVRPPDGVYYCSTVFCDREADRLKSLLSGSTGPCDDFYLHVCDNWVRSQRLPSAGTGSAISSDTMIQDDLIAALEAGLVSKKRQVASVAVALYDACTDHTQSGRALAAVAELFQRWKIGRWPTDAPASPKDAWLFAGQLLKDVGLKALVDVFAAIDADEPATVTVGLGKPRFLFSCNDAARPAVVNMFRDALAETMAAVTQASSQQLIDEIMQVITRLSSSPLEPSDSEIGMRGFDVIRLSDLHSGIADLLRATFENNSNFRPETKVVLKSSDYVQGHLVTALRELAPRAVMNYLGFQALIILAPFFLDRHRLLRQLFSKSVLGRTLPEVSNTSRLCAVAVERVLPGCFARMLHLPSSEGLDKLSQLVTSFGRSVEHLAWMDDMAVVLSRYLLKDYATLPRGDDAWCPSSTAPFATDSSIKFFVAVSRDRQQRSMKAGGAALSHLLTFATHDVARRRVHVPAALFNSSVPTNTSHFSLQFARFAVRFYRALVEAVLRRDTVPASLRYGDDPVRRFEDLLDCFEWELRQLPAALRPPIAPDSTAARGAFLQQTVAVQLAFRAFQELLQIRRTWNLDFRFAQLPDLSVGQLFFVYYALDNCEAADRVYQEHRGHWLPARYRVNVPLRNVVEFPEVFECAPHSNMVRFSFVPACTVVSVNGWLKSQPE